MLPHFSRFNSQTRECLRSVNFTPLLNLETNKLISKSPGVSECALTHLLDDNSHLLANMTVCLKTVSVRRGLGHVVFEFIPLKFPFQLFQVATGRLINNVLSPRLYDHARTLELSQFAI